VTGGAVHMKVKRSTLAGTWYPARSQELAAQIDRWLGDADGGAARDLLALIVPHAGYAYSGAVAASGYRRLRARPLPRAVILAPSHRVAFRGIAVLEADAFETPLGLVPIDAVRGIRSKLLRPDPRPFEGEHSLEIQLPFLQRAVPGVTVTPLLFGDLRPEDSHEVGGLLDRLIDERTVFVVSSDFTHYGRSFGYLPFPPDDAESVRLGLRRLDMGAIAAVLRGDAAAFRRHIEETGDTICGRVPVAALIEWAGTRHPGELLEYRTSLDVTGDYRHAVSYAAIAFAR
jgi:AmmeMemoRadiSam system protein B